MSARAVPSPRPTQPYSPRPRQPYSPRCPSPLGLPPMGFPPLAPHMAFQSPSYPVTPERPVQPKGPSETRVPFPPEARRPLAGSQRRRSQPPAPLNLDNPHHPPTQPRYPETAQPGATHEMSERRSTSPTPSDTSSLSLYSAESVHKNFPVGVVNQEQGEAEEKPPSLFCGCINLKALFGSKSKQKILAPPAPAASPVPQMVQTRRRPTPLNL